MAMKQNASSRKKEGEITRSERTSATEKAETVLKNVKAKTGNVIHIAISKRTTIELPSNLSPEEINFRIQKYETLLNRRHK